jgi:CheY-like chemotaxis protein
MHKMRGLTLNITYSSYIIINNSINFIHICYYIFQVTDYVVSIVRMTPLILQSILVVCEKRGCRRQPDHQIPVNHYASEEKRWLAEPFRFKNVQPPPIVYLENPTTKEKNLNQDQKSYTQNNPVQISPETILEGSDEANEFVKKHPMTLMLVDDDRDILFTFKSILSAEGFKVEAFADPNEALNRFMQADASYYNLVITDIRMPKINGFQLYQKLKEIKRDIRVLFMTAFEVQGNLLESMPNIDESDIIRKPIEEERFINKIKTAVNLE